MLEKIVAQIILGLWTWLEKRIERGTIAVDADLDKPRLRRAGTRIREWLRENGASQSGKPDTSGANGQGSDVHPYRRRVGVERKQT